MKQTSYISIGLILIGAVLATSCESSKPLPQNKRLVVAVAPFDISDQRFPQDLEGQLVSALLETKRFRVIERQKLTDLMQENELSLTGLMDPSQAEKVLKLTGADAILFVKSGVIKGYSGRTDDSVTGWWSDVTEAYEVSWSARLVSATSGELIGASSRGGKAEAGTFSGAMGVETVNKTTKELIAEAATHALSAIAYDLGEQYQPE